MAAEVSGMLDDRLLWAPRAWVDGAWAESVLLRIDASGEVPSEPQD